MKRLDIVRGETVTGRQKELCQFFSSGTPGEEEAENYASPFFSPCSILSGKLAAGEKKGLLNFSFS